VSNYRTLHLWRPHFERKFFCIKLQDSCYPESHESDPRTGPYEYDPHICRGFVSSVAVPGSIINILHAVCVKTVARLFCVNARHNESLPDSFAYTFLQSSAMVGILTSRDCIYRSKIDKPNVPFYTEYGTSRFLRVLGSYSPSYTASCSIKSWS
jgi:hypothetical protein